MKPSIKQSTTRSAGRDLKLIAVAAFFLYLGFGVYSATYNNFFAGTVGMKPEQLGVLESLRESPGLAMALVLALAMHIAEPILGSMALAVIALGFLGYARYDSYVPIVLCSVLWSIGLHMWMPLQSAMTLSLAEEGKKGKRLGQIGASVGFGTTLGILTVLILSSKIIYSKSVPYSIWYMSAAISIAIGAVFMWFVRRDLSPPDKPRLVLKRDYRLYYGLTFLEGCRKQVFITLAPYVLVKAYGASLQTMACLMLINNVMNLIGTPIVGRLIDRIGERKILTVSYSGLFLVFLGYALIPHVYVLCVLYCMDSLLYLSTMGLTTYLNRISEKRDLVPSLSMGVTMNHLAAVIVPVLGGFLWKAIGYQIIFFAGSIVVLTSISLARRVHDQ
jgi:MFS family permease